MNYFKFRDENQFNSLANIICLYVYMYKDILIEIWGWII